MEPSQDSAKKQTLHVHEWLAVVVIIGLMGMLTTVSMLSPRLSQSVTTATPHNIVDPFIEVAVDGAVEKPECAQRVKSSHEDNGARVCALTHECIRTRARAILPVKRSSEVRWVHGRSRRRSPYDLAA